MPPTNVYLMKPISEAAVCGRRGQQTGKHHLEPGAYLIVDRARTAEESRGASVCGGGGTRWAAAAAAAALLPVWELVGGGDCERARRPEGALPRRRAEQARAAGARPP